MSEGASPRCTRPSAARVRIRPRSPKSYGSSSVPGLGAIASQHGETKWRPCSEPKLHTGSGPRYNHNSQNALGRRREAEVARCGARPCAPPPWRKPSGIRCLLWSPPQSFLALADGTCSSSARELNFPQALRNYTSRWGFGACAQDRDAYYDSRRALRRARLRADALS